MKPEIRAAYEAVRGGLSADRVVADEVLNRRFLTECQNRGLIEAPVDLNRALLNLRKNRGLRGAERSRTTSFRDEDDYRFASEMAVRFLERRDQISLDLIICDPEKAREFDELASRIAPGFTSLQYRWAALNLRKRQRLPPEIISHALPSRSVSVVPVDELDTRVVPVEHGLYLFFDEKQALYVGEATILRNRIEKHLEHSDNKGLARWLWEHGTERLFLELHVLDSSIATRVRKALEAELIASRRPVFNVQNV